MRISDYELSHLILRFEQEKDMKVMHCVQNLAALRDLVDLRIEAAGLRKLVAKSAVTPTSGDQETAGKSEMQFVENKDEA